MFYFLTKAWFSLATQALAQAQQLLFHRENDLDATINTSTNTVSLTSGHSTKVQQNIYDLQVVAYPRGCKNHLGFLFFKNITNPKGFSSLIFCDRFRFLHRKSRLEISEHNALKCLPPYIGRVKIIEAL